MDISKIAISIGNISFSGEGDQAWLSEQLDKILSQADQLIKLVPPQESAANQNKNDRDGSSKISENASKPLATFLKEKNATVKQVEKFLATAIWLETAKGKNRMATADVSAALKVSNQSKLNNPAECLNQNVSKGYCEKEGKEFFVTQEGKSALGF